MIPKEARDLINLHLEQARKSELDDFAERMLHAVESMFAFALAANMLKPREHANEIIMIDLVRAQRKNRICSA